MVGRVRGGLVGVGLNQSRWPVLLGFGLVVLFFGSGGESRSARAAEISSAARAMQLARDGASAAEKGESATYLEKMTAAADLRADFPRILVNLAAAQVASEQPGAAIATLERLAALGMHSPVEKSEDFAPLRGLKEFQAVVKKLAANLHPRGAGALAFSLREVTGLIEGIAWREKTGQFFFGDVNGRAVWVRSAGDERLRRFTAEGGELLGVFGLVVDEVNGALWAATSAVPAMQGFTADQDGVAALAEIDLATGAVRRTLPAGRRAGDQASHVLGDLALAADGGIILTDSGGAGLWRLAPGGDALNWVVESTEFLSLQGIVLLPSGLAVVSDHANGLLRVDWERSDVRRLMAPAGTTLIGLDGLALAADGSILAVQNGLRPNRLLKVELDATAENITAVTVLESGHLTMAAPALGCIATDGDFFFVGNSGWARFDETGGRPSSPRVVPIFRTSLAPKKTGR